MEDIIDIIVTETTNTIEITAQPNDEIIDVNIIDNREDVTLNVTPTVVEININSLTGNFGVEWGDITGTLADQTDLNNALALKANLVGGKVPASELPSYVDDVVEVANFAALPATGETGKIYITLDNNKIYRWSGSVYVEIADSTAVWGAITGTLSSQTDLQSALNAKEPTITAGTTAQYYRGDKTFQTLNTTAVTEGTNLYYTDVRVSANTDVAANTAARHNAVTIGTANGLSLSTQILSLGLASSSANGALSSTDWNTFNAKQQALSGTGFVKISGTTISYDNSTYLTTSSAASTYVPYTGATGNVDLGTHTLLAAKGTFSSSGSADTVGITHSSGSGIALNITKGGNGEGIYVNKSSGSGNAVTIVGTLNATTLVKNGGTSSQFLKADGSVDSSTYLTTGTAASTYLPLAGGTLTGNLNGTNITISNSLIAKGGTFNGGASAAGIVTIDGLSSNVLMNRTDTNNGTLISFLTNAVEMWHIGMRSGGTDNFVIYNSNLLANAVSVNISNSEVTLAGALNGTSAVFSSSVRSSGYYLTGMTSGSGALYYSSGSNRVTVANYNTNGIVLFEVNGGATALTLNANLSATFASTLSATGATLTGALSGTTGSFSSTLTTTGGTRNIQLVSFASDYNYIRSNGAQLVVGTQDSNDLFIQTNNTTRLTLVGATGAATFTGDLEVSNPSTTTGKFYISGTQASARRYLLENGITGVSNAGFQIRDITGGFTPFYITASGAATFSGDVTTGNASTIKSSSNFLIVQAATNLILDAASGSVNIRTNSSDKVVVTNGGNVGIGTTPSPWTTYLALQIGSGSSVAGRNDGLPITLYSSNVYLDGANYKYILNKPAVQYVQDANGGSHWWSIAPSGSAGGNISFTQAMTLTSDGNLLVGMTSSGAASSAAIRAGQFSGQTATSANPVVQAWNQATSGDNQFIHFYTESGGGALRGSIDYNRAAGLVRYNVTSDYRLKTDLKEFNGSDILNKVKVYDYKLKETGARVYGVMAHELQEVIPYAVTGVKDGERMQGVDYSKIVPVLIQAIKDQQVQIEQLKNK
jgi:hypothetical protein